jgi:hypothetical protein
MKNDLETTLSELYQSHRPAVPAGFAQDVLHRVLAEQRYAWRKRLVGRTLIAASVVLALGVGLGIDKRLTRKPEVVLNTPVVVNAPSMSEKVQEGRATLAAMTERAGETALAPTRKYWEAPRPELPTTTLQSTKPEYPTVTPQTMEPLTGTTRRAVTMFIKDIRSIAALPEKR